MRGALAWLIRRECLERRDVSRTATAVYRVVQPRAKPDQAVSPTTATGYPTATEPEGPRLPEKGQAEGQAGAKPKPWQTNGLRDRATTGRAKPRAKVLEDREDYYLKPRQGKNVQ